MGMDHDHHRKKPGPPDEEALKRLKGYEARERKAAIGNARWDEEVAKAQETGLPAADSIEDRSISTFARTELPHFVGINTFMGFPYVEDVREVSNYDVAVLGAPLDAGTTYRSGTRFGPQAIRRISGLYSTYNYEFGVDLRESLRACDFGDVFTIPANIEKSFDQISRAVDHVAGAGVFPVVLGGDHSIGYPDIRGLAPHIEGNVGIIHLDRHVDIQEKDMDERMHTTPWFHATNIPNAPAKNLVQCGIGGWQVPRSGVEVARDRQTTVMTIGDVEAMGVDRAAELALEVAWDGAEAVCATKQIGGAFLAFYLISQVGGVGVGSADEPIEQFLQGFELLFPAGVALVVPFVLVVISQMKINVTNAYAGSLAWSNFFSRVFHWHPGRVWWVLLNVGIALTLMLVGVFEYLNYVLGFYANVAIAWIGAVVADLLINKPLLRVSPSYIEFKRAHLYQFNPVGFGSMAVAVVVSISAFFGLFGDYAQAFSPFLAIGIAFVLSPILAVATRGKYYIARGGSTSEIIEDDESRYDTRTCGVCGGDYEAPDMASCPFHETQICSLCCTLEKECKDMCKKPVQLGSKPGVESGAKD